jgi:hypothetical protein
MREITVLMKYEIKCRAVDSFRATAWMTKRMIT